MWNDPRVIEGICTCTEVTTGGFRFPPSTIRRYSLRCGLSSHRVKAAAEKEIAREAK